jgi:hypothetical protein
MAWSVSAALFFVAVVLFIVALIVALTDYGSNWAAWLSAGCIAFAAGHLPWRA